ncbi:MAG: trypsin-like peptidase domain-containing protein, partial [Spirochaetales bacterium]
LLVASCAQNKPLETPSPDYSTLKAEELKALAETDPEACLEAISLIANSQRKGLGLDAESLGAAALDATRKLITDLDSRIAGGQLKDAERSSASIRAITATSNALFSEAVKAASNTSLDSKILMIYLDIAQSYYDKKLYSPADAYVLKSLDLVDSAKKYGRNAVVEQSVLVAWYIRAADAGDMATAHRILLYVDAIHAKALEDRSSIGIRTTTISEKADGVVTVYVDKGLKIEKGVGYPDRMLGTAFQVDAQGYYLTNYHVISSEVDPAYNGFSRISIRPPSNPDARIPAKVIGWNEDLDLALLKSAEISTHTFYPFKAGKADKGQRVYAIGSPVGLENSVTAGIVSATGRRILPRGDAIQIDAPVNPGNSGGPLLDDNGDLVGVVFAGLSGFQGLNFALPVAWISAIFPALFDGGKVETSWIGAGLAKNLDASLDISYVFPGTSKALQRGDTLLSIDGAKIIDIQGAQMLLAMKPLGSLCAVAVSRDGSTINLLLKTRAAPSMPFKSATKRDASEQLLEGATGMVIEHVSGARGEGGTYKVVKTWPGMAADESGIGAADVLKFVRYSVDDSANTINFDVSVKSLNADESFAGNGQFYIVSLRKDRKKRQCRAEKG